jgi:hypothetical protein
VKNSLAIVMLFFLLGVNAQAVFEIKSPSTIKGFYTFGIGDSTVHYWSNGNTAKKSITASLALATGLDSLASAPLIGDYKGKIAVVHRGVSYVPTKALNAQNAGAVAVIVINHGINSTTKKIDSNEVYNVSAYLPNETPTTATGLKVTIPVLIVSLKTGLSISKELRAGEIVEAYIGKKPILDYNLKLDPKYLSAPLRRTRPELLVQEGMVYDTLQFAIINEGAKIQRKVLVTNKIEYKNVIIHADTFYIDSINPGDTLGYFYKKSPFSPKYDLLKGDYKLTWNVANLTSNGSGGFKDTLIDQYPYDNSVVLPFYISDTIASNVVLSSSGLPVSNVGYSANSTSGFGVCHVFQDPYASKMHANAITFGAYNFSAAKKLKNHVFTLDVFEWTDSFYHFYDTTASPTDNDYFKNIKSSTFSFIPLIDKQNFISNVDAYSGMQNVKLDNPILFENNKRYLFCVNTTKADSVGFMFNTDPSSSVASFRYKQPIMMLAVDGRYDIRGFSPSFTILPSISLSVFKNSAASVDNSISADATMNVYPNPSHDEVNLSFSMDKASDVIVSITDLTGKRLYSKSVKTTSGNNSIPIDVSVISKGVYVLSLSSDMVNATRRIVIEK